MLVAVGLLVGRVALTYIVARVAAEAVTNGIAKGIDLSIQRHEQSLLEGR